MLRRSCKAATTPVRWVRASWLGLWHADRQRSGLGSVRLRLRLGRGCRQQRDLGWRRLIGGGKKGGDKKVEERERKEREKEKKKRKKGKKKMIRVGSGFRNPNLYHFWFFGKKFHFCVF